MQAALHDNVVPRRFGPNFEDKLAVIDFFELEAAARERLEEQLLLGPDARTENADPHYSPQSSSSSGASRSSSGSRCTTSSSAPQSAQGTISPRSTSGASCTSASHSGHCAVKTVDITTPPRWRPSRGF